jgi:hypothetical protein
MSRAAVPDVEGEAGLSGKPKRINFRERVACALTGRHSHPRRGRLTHAGALTRSSSGG